jgi:hypothetical protein
MNIVIYIYQLTDKCTEVFKIFNLYQHTYFSLLVGGTMPSTTLRFGFFVLPPLPLLPTLSPAPASAHPPHRLIICVAIVWPRVVPTAAALPLAPPGPGPARAVPTAAALPLAPPGPGPALPIVY